MLYALLKSIHVLGVVLLVGNAVVTLIWKMAADATGDPRVIAFGQRLVVRTDWWFTVGGVLVTAIAGYGAAAVVRMSPLQVPWLVWGQVLFGASGLLWALVLVPSQIRQGRQARAFAEGGNIPPGYWRDSRRWQVWGILATLLLVAAIWVMIAKPA